MILSVFLDFFVLFFVFLVLIFKNLNLITRTPFGVFHRESKWVFQSEKLNMEFYVIKLTIN